MGPNSGGSTNTVQNTNAFIPPWLEDYTKQAVTRAGDLSNQPYTPYTGQTVADVNQAQRQAYDQTGAMQGMGTGGWNAAINANWGLAGQASPVTAGGVNNGTNALFNNFQQGVYDPASANLNNAYYQNQNLFGNAQSQNQNVFGNAYDQSQGLLGGYAGQGPATAQGIGQNAQQLMSPYTQQVIDPALRAGQQQLALAKQGISDKAIQVGAFGGSRQGVEEGVADAQNALGTQQFIGNMLNQGWGNALQSGTNIGLQAGQQGLAASSALAQQGYNSANALAQQGYGSANALAQQGYGSANALNNTLGQGYGASQTGAQNMANTNLQAGLTGAQQLPGALSGQQAASLGQINALNQAGTLQQQYQQNILNSQQAAFAQQQAFPYQQIQTLLGAASGIPYSTSNTGSFSQEMASDPVGQVIGGVATTGGLLGNTGSLIDSLTGTNKNAVKSASVA
jgi:hypothetical protein